MRLTDIEITRLLKAANEAEKRWEDYINSLTIDRGNSHEEIRFTSIDQVNQSSELRENAEKLWKQWIEAVRDNLNT